MQGAAPPRAAPTGASCTARGGAAASGRWPAALGGQSRPRKLPERRPHQAAAPHAGYDVPASVQAQLRGRAAALQPVAPSFRVFKVVGDGACMFRSIVQGVQIATRGSPMTPDSETSAARNLRQAVVAELAKRREEIEPFIPGILDGDTTFEAYLQRMAHPAAWGGEPEMVMAASVVRMPIHVWRVTPAGAELIVTYGDELRGAAPPINVLWHRAGHYDLLVSDLPSASPAA